MGVLTPPLVILIDEHLFLALGYERGKVKTDKARVENNLNLQYKCDGILISMNQELTTSYVMSVYSRILDY